MQTDDLIAIDKFCTSHKLEISFIDLLCEHELITITRIQESSFIPAAELQKLEKIIRLHHDLDINVAGIEAIEHLLTRIEEMQHEMLTLKTRLFRYESQLSGDLPN